MKKNQKFVNELYNNGELQFFVENWFCSLMETRNELDKRLYPLDDIKQNYKVVVESPTSVYIKKKIDSKLSYPISNISDFDICINTKMIKEEFASERHDQTKKWHECMVSRFGKRYEQFVKKDNSAEM